MSIAKKLVGNENDRAVSPVIGVILMVAITVILAAVIAAFVLDIGDLDDSAPQAQYNWESDGDKVTWTHQSGDDIDLGDLEVSIAVNVSTGAGADEFETGTISQELSSGDFTAGEQIIFEYEYDSGSSTHNIVLSESVDHDVPLTDVDGIDDHSDIDDLNEIEEVVVTWHSDGTSTIIADYEP